MAVFLHCKGIRVPEIQDRFTCVPVFPGPSIEKVQTCFRPFRLEFLGETFLDDADGNGETSVQLPGKQLLHSKVSGVGSTVIPESVMGGLVPVVSEDDDDPSQDRDGLVVSEGLDVSLFFFPAFLVLLVHVFEKAEMTAEKAQGLLAELGVRRRILLGEDRHVLHAFLLPCRIFQADGVLDEGKGVEKVQPGKIGEGRPHAFHGEFTRLLDNRFGEHGCLCVYRRLSS